MMKKNWLLYLVNCKLVNNEKKWKRQIQSRIKEIDKVVVIVPMQNTWLYI